MKIIQNNDIKQIKNIELEMIKWVEDALNNKKSSILPAKVSMTLDDGIFYNTMPCIIKSENVAGVKIVNRYPGRDITIGGEILLYDLENGRLKSLLDAEYITTMRTGAIAAHSILLFEKSDAKVFSWIGLGETAKATAKLYLKSTKKDDIIFRLFKHKDQHNTFMNYIKNLNLDKKIEFEFVDNYEDLMSNSDVIVSAVSYAPEDFVEFEVFSEGVLVVPIHTRGFVDIDYKFDKIFADDYDHVKHFKYFDKYQIFNEVSEVIIDKTLGRNSDTEKIIVYNIGISLHDIYFANKIFNKLNYDLINN